MTKKQSSHKPKAATVALPADHNALKKLKLSLGLIIAAFAFILYVQSIGFDYTLDDGSVIKENTVTKQGIAGIPTILKHSYWYGINDTRVAEYRPASLVMFAIEWQLFSANPHVNHFVNVALFAITCWLLFLLLCELFKKQSMLIPFVCTLLYAAHPIHTEVVDSIKSRDEILCFLFVIIASLLLLKFIESKSIIHLILGGFSYLISLSSKETSISFLLVMPMVLYVFTNADTKRIIMITSLLFAVVGVYFIIRSLALRTITEVLDHSAVNNSLYAAQDFISQKATAFYILLKYLFLMLLPHPLSYDYSFNQIPIQTIANPLSLLGILVYFAIGIYAVITIRKKNYYAFGILFFLLTLVPVSNIFLLIGATMAERFLYMPSLGFCLIVTLVLIKITKTDSLKTKFSNIKQFMTYNSSLMIIVFIITGMYALKTLDRSQDWKDNVHLFGHDVEVVPNSTRAHVNYGVALLKDQYTTENKEAAKDQILDKAIIEFKRGLEIYPDNNDAYDALGQACFVKKDYKAAIFYLEKLEANFPFKSSEDYKYLSQCYEHTKQFEKQAAVLDSILKFEPNSDSVYVSLGIAYGQAGKDSSAIEAFKNAIKINPKSKGAYKDIGVTYGNKGQSKLALEYFNKSLAIDSTDAECYRFIAGAYQLAGDTEKARQYMAKSVYYSNNQH